MGKEGYKPTAGMQSAARRAIKLKEQGKAKGAGTAVGWTRAGQLARGESLSLDTVKRMYSFFSRHEVDKKGKDWDNAENPSNGKIMWLAWGGDAGFSWSRKIVEREKNMKKSDSLNEIVEEIKDMFDNVINPITKVNEIEDDEEDYVSDDEEMDKWDNIQKACWTGYKQEGMKEKDGRMVPNCVPVEKVEKMNNDLEKAVKPEVSKETLLEVIKELQEIIVGMVEIEEPENESETETEAPEMEVEDANPAPIGDPEKNDINWPVEKSMENETEMQNVWKGSFDPDLTKRKFNAKQRKQMAESGNAMPDGSFPIGNKNDLMNAIRSWGRGGSDPKVKAHIKRRAKELGAEDMIPKNWK